MQVQNENNQTAALAPPVPRPTASVLSEIPLLAGTAALSLPSFIRRCNASHLLFAFAAATAGAPQPAWKVGQVVDAQDAYGDWYEATVMEVWAVPGVCSDTLPSY